MTSKDFIEQLEKEQAKLAKHPLYRELRSIEHLRLFMQGHVFAVWDFMSLLKSLQKEMTCVHVPWTPSAYPKKIVRMINQIVLGEESDLDFQGEASDHFSMYLKAMEEVGADTSKINKFLEHFDLSLLQPCVSQFVAFTMDLALNRPPHLVAAAFFFGRERLIPEMFSGIINELKRAHQDYPQLLYYFERHIELDGEEHLYLAKSCMEILCDKDPRLFEEAYQVGIQSLRLRRALWDGILEQIKRPELTQI